MINKLFLDIEAKLTHICVEISHITHSKSLDSHVKIFTSLLSRKFLITGLLLLVLSLQVIAQDFMNVLGVALKEGNSKVIAQYFDNELDLTFSDKTNSYSRKQAQIILESFFSKERPRMYVRMQSSTPGSNNTRFSIGKLYTSSGEYRVYMFFVYRSGQYFLKELRFEK